MARASRSCLVGLLLLGAALGGAPAPAAARTPTRGAPAARAAALDAIAPALRAGAQPPARVRDAKARPHRFRAALRRFRERVGRTIRQTGLVLSAGVNTGLIVAGAGVEGGYVIRPADPLTGRRVHGPYASVGGSLLFLGRSKVFSPNPLLTGKGSTTAVLSQDPIYGRTVWIPVLPGVISMGIGRNGGFGLHFTHGLIKYKSGPGYLGVNPLGATVGFYVTNPALARFTDPILNVSDKVAAKVNKITAPIIEWAKRAWHKLPLPWERKPPQQRPSPEAPPGPGPDPPLRTAAF